MMKYMFSERVIRRNFVAKDLRTPKYRQRSETPKKMYDRNKDKRIVRQEIYGTE
jgi:hypothetical protein